MDSKYKKLFSNTIIFSIGTFSSKILVFLLVPFYVHFLSDAEYGVVDLITQTANLLIPLVSLGIASAVLRFGLDEASDKKAVFSTGVTAILLGFAVFLLTIPILNSIRIIGEYTLLLFVYVFVGCFRLLCTNFVRSLQYVRLYSFDGLLCTILVIGFNILFLMHLGLGIEGYVLATICSDLCSVIFLTVTGRLYRYLDFSRVRAYVYKPMLRYCLPLIPANVFWWVTHVSDRYMVTYMVGESTNGLYAIAYKIPTMITIVSTIFMEAWQLSAVVEKNDPELPKFFSSVLSYYQSFVFLCGSGCILFARVLIYLLTLGEPDYYVAWRYVPSLIIATCFSCFVTFLGSVYVVEKKSMTSFLTTLLGAVVNVILNLLLIPFFGANGAAVATASAYLAVYLVRAYNTRRMIPMDFSFGKTAVNTVLLIAQSAVMLLEVPCWWLFSGAIFAAVTVINLRSLVRALLQLVAKHRGR